MTNYNIILEIPVMASLPVSYPPYSTESTEYTGNKTWGGNLTEKVRNINVVTIITISRLWCIRLRT